MIYVIIVLWFILSILIYTGYEHDLREVPFWAKLTIMTIIFVFAPAIAIFSVVAYYYEENDEENYNDF